MRTHLLNLVLSGLKRPRPTPLSASCWIAFCLLSYSLGSGIANAEQSSNRRAHCFDEIDRATLAFENGRADQAKDMLSLLAQSCADVPHLHHNIGALALLEQKWDEAIRHFEKSLALDSRAAMTHKTLASIYQYQASTAYRQALKLSGPEPRLPEIKMQSSSLRNSEQINLQNHQTGGWLSDDTSYERGAEQLGQVHLDEVRFDLASWWRAQRMYDLDAYFAYYPAGVYPAHFDTSADWSEHWNKALNTHKNALPEWADVSVSVEPLGHYIVVNLHYSSALTPSDPATQKSVDLNDQGSDKLSPQHKMLVMQKQQKLWQIIKEKSW